LRAAFKAADNDAAAGRPAILLLDEIDAICPSRGGGGGQGLTLVHFSAQPEPILTQNTP